MSNQLKPGAMAMIVGANVLTQNIGKVVELSSFVQDGDLYAGPDGKLWRHGDVGCWIVRGEDVQFRADDEVYTGFGVCEGRHLMPIPGSPEPAINRSRELVK